VRRRFLLLVAATTGMVLVVFVIPLGLIVRGYAAELATNEATSRAESLVVLVADADVDPSILKAAVAQLNATGAYPVTVFLPDGTRLGAPAGQSTAVKLAERGQSVTVATPAGREITLSVSGMAGGTAVVRTFASSAQLGRGVARGWLILAVLAAALFILALFIADRLAVALVRSIARLAQVSHRLAAGDLDARAETAGAPEVAAVSAALNHLAGRIQDLVDQAHEEIADLSHRLRTPLTALRMESDLMATGAPTLEQAQRVTARVAAVEQAVTALIRDARARSEREPHLCDASAVIRERLEFWGPLAHDEERTVTADITTAVLVRLAASDLIACVDALLGNVFTHTPARTPLSVGLERHRGGARLQITDHGPGFDVSDATRRGTSGAGSSGLGLDGARVIVELGGP
jgi:signal transduction histidine kinase